MTKQVYDNAMVAHIWAHQSQNSARSHNGNFSFEGDTIYSYQTPIARIVRGATGQPVALRTREKYSVTTTVKHESAISRALGPGDGAVMPEFGVVSMGIRAGHRRAEPGDGIDHAANLVAFVADYEAAKARARRVRDPWWTTAEHVIEGPALAAQAYAEAFGLPMPELNVEADATAIATYRAERDARLSTPEALAKRERERTKRAERKAERERAETERRKIEAAEAIANWRAHVNDGYQWTRPLYNVPVMLRLSKDSTRIQTSHGAEFPLEHGTRAWPIIRRCRERGEGWQPNGHSVHLGHFQVSRIDDGGNVRAGCHFVEYAEIERLARELGLIEGGDHAA